MILSVPLILSAVVLLVTLLAASWQDARSRTVYTVTWYPAAIIGGVCAVLFWTTHISDPLALFILILSVLIAGMMAAFSFFGLFGKADAKALILLALTVPVTPFAAYIFPSLAVSSIVNAGLIILIVPVFYLVSNIIHKNKAPFWLMCSGRPVPGPEVTRYFGFIAEEITETGDGIVRKFCPVSDAFSSLRTHSARMIRVLRENPEKYADDIARYAKCQSVWIITGLPFLIPLTAGYIFALFGISAVDFILA
jgi:archaeal preflagellin peptidase FlaK